MQLHYGIIVTAATLYFKIAYNFNCNDPYQTIMLDNMMTSIIDLTSFLYNCNCSDSSF